MLKRFSVENFSSLREEQTLDMTSGTTTVLTNHIAPFAGVGLLKSAVIYGANASGKSNIVRAIEFGKKVIVNGISSLDVYKKYFRLDTHCSTKQTSFEFEVEIDDDFYSYGFSLILKDKLVSEEWLYKLNGRKEPTLIFERNSECVNISEQLRNESDGRFKIYAEDVINQSAQLFLSEIADKNLNIQGAVIFNKLYQWFSEKLIVVYPDDKFLGMNNLDKDFTDLLSSYLRRFDTGVTSIDTIDEDFEDNLKDLPSELKAKIENDLSKVHVKEIAIKGMGVNPQFLTVYKNSDGDIKVKKLGFVHSGNRKDIFELEDESDGTKRLLDFIPLISSFSSDTTVVIDEFDRSLHPMLTKEFFSIFHQASNKKAQLIVTTHESTLLDLDEIRRDEVWFVEKNSDGSSSLYSLNKFKVRYDSKIEKAYLLGRYGAIPVFSDFENL